MAIYIYNKYIQEEKLIINKMSLHNSHSNEVNRMTIE